MILAHNIQAEQEVLAAVLLDNEKILEVMDLLQPNDFYSHHNRLLYEAMINLYTQDKPIDIISLKEYFKDDLKPVGGFSYISQLASSSLGYKKAHADIVKENANMRKLQIILDGAVKDTEKKDFKKLLRELQDRTLSLETSDEKVFINDEELMKLTIKLAEVNHQNGGGILGIQTGITPLDKGINGLQKKKLYVLAGRPGMGKSALALNICQNISRKYNVDYYSLEMAEEELGLRRLAMTSFIDTNIIERGAMSDDEWVKMMKHASLISKNKCVTNCKPGIHLNEIRAQAKKRKLQEGLDLIIVDHIGYMDYTGMGDTIREQTSNVCLGFKKIAKELDIPIIILCQLSRGVEHRGDKRPMLSDLKESSGIEENADVVMLLYRDEYYNKDTYDKNVIECNIAKQRGGRTGTVKLGWHGAYQKIADVQKG